jgi:WhiB family redox-sensing transcriptional regulator
VTTAYEIAPDLAPSPPRSAGRHGLRALPPRRELLAVERDWQWQLEGACREADPDLFFHPWGERDPRRSRREAAAKAVCDRCPVQQLCAEQALSTYEAYGVWGGLSEHDREEILGVRFD